MIRHWEPLEKQGNHCDFTRFDKGTPWEMAKTIQVMPIQTLAIFPNILIAKYANLL